MNIATPSQVPVKPPGDTETILGLITDSTIEHLSNYLNEYEVKDIINSGEYSGWTPLLYATFNQKVKAMELILDHGGDIDLADSDGVTPLILASEYGLTDCVELLINRGADLAKLKVGEETALAVAIRRGLPEIERLLRSALESRPLLK